MDIIKSLNRVYVATFKRYLKTDLKSIKVI